MHEQLKTDLPTIEDLAQEFPAMSVVKLRMEIERALRDFTASRGLTFERPESIATILKVRKDRGISPPNTDEFLEVLRIMNKAVHGLDVDSKAVAEAVSIATTFLAELSRSGS